MEVILIGLLVLAVMGTGYGLFYRIRYNKARYLSSRGYKVGYQGHWDGGDWLWKKTRSIYEYDAKPYVLSDAYKRERLIEERERLHLPEIESKVAPKEYEDYVLGSFTE